MRALLMSALFISGCVAMSSSDVEIHEADVTATEQSFADTMRDRDFAAFRSYLADGVIFITGQRQLRGKAAVAAGWSRYFEGEVAPFSWRPETVVVQDSGRLALSSGPVHGADGQQVGIFTSIWRRESDGRWRIILDKGGCACD